MGDATANVEPEANNDSSGMETTHSNLRCFLDSVTPIVETHKVPKPPFLPLPNNYCGKVIDGVKCFYLGDLWNKFYEWSTCGVGTPVRLPSGETVVQYFVPYLSAIQLYTNNNNVPTPQSLGWHSDYNVIHGRRFDDYNKNGFINTMYPNGYEAPSHISKLGDKSPRSICKGELFFKYFELDSPYEREPFVDKVYELSCNCPSLASLSSLELSPSSWVSVFWYPMSHVPAKNLKDLNTCFLTYHSLSTSEEYVPLDSWNAFDHLALAPFGLATHKLDHKVWASPKSGDQEHISSLFGAAQSWLKKNNIYHNDFNYFLRNNFT